MALGMALCGCDSHCRVEITDQARIENRTGRDLSLLTCNGDGLIRRQLGIPAAQSGAFVLGTRATGYVNGGVDSLRDCGPASETVDLRVALAPESFADARFCYANVEETDVIVVGVADPCPVGTVVQTEGEDCSP